MKQPRRPARSSVMFFTFAAWSIGATALSLLTSGAGASGHAKFEAEEKAARARCASAPHSDPWCAPEGSEVRAAPVLALYQAAKASLDTTVNTPHSREDEARELSRTFERAWLISAAGTPISALAAAKLVDEAGDRLDRDPGLLADEKVNRVLGAMTFDAPRHPFAAERANILLSMTKVPGQGRIPNTPLTHAATGAVMQRVDDTLAKMEKATLAGNVGSCMKALEEGGPLVRPFVSGPTTCVNADRVVRAGHRLASLRIRASVAAANRPREGESVYRKM